VASCGLRRATPLSATPLNSDQEVCAYLGHRNRGGQRDRGGGDAGRACDDEGCNSGQERDEGEFEQHGEVWSMKRTGVGEGMWVKT
jgi:hypothetical protein